MNFNLGDFIKLKDCSRFPSEYKPDAIGEVIGLDEYAYWTDGNETAINVRWINGDNAEQSSVVLESNAILVDVSGKHIIKPVIKKNKGKRFKYEF